jgi:hypothetical protein
MSYHAAVLGTLLVSCASVAWSQSLTCSFTPQSGSIPAGVLTGQIAVEDEDSNLLYIYDLSSGQTYPVPLSGLTNAENPVFTPDGSAILFSADNGTEYDLYYWKIGMASPVDLTPSSSNKNQDVKFSPDGSMIVWKREATVGVGGIAVANISFSGGTPSLSNITQLASGSAEQSGPVFSPDQKYIYYYANNGSGEPPGQIWRYDIASQSTQSAFAQDATVYHYYPVYPDLYNFMYVSPLPVVLVPCGTKCLDKIFVRAKLPSVGTAWNTTDCASDNSDPAPVSQDYFIYSRDNPGNNSSQHNTQYDLYLGQISTGNSWFLLKPSDLNIVAGDSSLVGSNYTPVPASGGSQSHPAR